MLAEALREWRAISDRRPPSLIWHGKPVRYRRFDLKAVPGDFDWLLSGSTTWVDLGQRYRVEVEFRDGTKAEESFGPEPAILVQFSADHRPRIWCGCVPVKTGTGSAGVSDLGPTPA